MGPHHPDVGIPVDAGVHGGDQKVERAGPSLDGLRIGSDHHLVGSERLCFRPFGIPGGECRHVTSPRSSEFERQMTETTDSNHADPIGRRGELANRGPDRGPAREHRTGLTDRDAVIEREDPGPLNPNTICKPAMATHDRSLRSRRDIVIAREGTGAIRSV